SLDTLHMADSHRFAPSSYRDCPWMDSADWADRRAISAGYGRCAIYLFWYSRQDASNGRARAKHNRLSCLWFHCSQNRVGVGTTSKGTELAIVWPEDVLQGRALGHSEPTNVQSTFGGYGALFERGTAAASNLGHAFMVRANWPWRM